jgi:outer membrane protein OmpA-like peptidoglycan-associated protein
MKTNVIVRHLFSRQLATLVLASAVAVPLLAQQPQSGASTQSTPPAAVQQPSPTPSTMNTPKEGFWGRINPWARKKWVKKQTDPINDRLSELDQVTAKNASDIKDVDSRAQAGIHQAQSTADAANSAATAASSQAQQASTVAQTATGRVGEIGTKVDGLDQYRPVSDVEVPFKGGSPILSSEAKEQLDQVVSSVTGRIGYIIEVEAHSPGNGSVGIQHSQRLANVVNRYLVEHDIPVYRLHAVALGNAQTQTVADSDSKVRTSSVHVKLMENTLAAQGAASPQGVAPSTGAERP